MGLRCAAMMAGLTLAMTAGVARAETLRFDFNGVSAAVGTFSFDFQVNSHPTPNRSEPNDSFVIEDVQVSAKDSINGSSTASLDIIFLSRFLAGGFTIYDPSTDDGLRLLGDVVFTGPTSVPTFSTGTFDFTGFQTIGGNLAPNTDVIGTLIVSAVPLPASAPMFGAALLTFGAIGYHLKRKAATPV